MRAARCARAALALALAAGAAFAADVPYLTGRVVDNAEILAPATRDKLTAALKAHEDASTDQIAVLTVPTIGGEAIEQYATRVFDAWKLGQKGKDNGVLVIVVPNDRKMRIEVGYGLEGTLTDVASSRIIRDRMTPRFKEGNYDHGVSDGVDAIIAQLEGRARIGAGKRADGELERREVAGADRRPGAGVADAHPARRIHFRHHRNLHRRRRDDAGRRLVPVRVPDSVLGDVSDHHRRNARHAVAAWHLRRRLSDRQADPVAAAVVSEGGAAI